ncbi:MAG: thioredoxin fold domain-containing protein [Bacteroidetes bacterium]|nr:thioredoxin fold domain-containing protein [Bacteroidota bacterium]
MKKTAIKITLILIFAVFNLYGQLFNKDVIQIKTFNSFDKIYQNSEFLLALKINVDEGWHINSNTPNEDYLVPTKLSILSKDGIIEKVDKILYPEPEDIQLAFSKIPLSVWQGEALIGAKIKLKDNVKPGKYKLIVNLDYQACNNNTCLAPSNIVDTLEIEVVNNTVPTNQINQSIFNSLKLTIDNTKYNGNDEGFISDMLESNGLLLGLLFVFIGGLALNLTPCVYPLIPITIGYFGGQSEGSTKKLFFMGLLFVLGMSITYSIIGVVTSLTGALFGSLLQNMYVILFIVLVFIVMSLGMFGVYEFKLPDSLVTKAGGAKGGMFGAFFMGLTMGIVAAPCIGPFVIGLVTLVAAKGDPLYGFIMFFVLSLGLGLPYLFLAIFSGKIKQLPRAGEWMDAVKHIFGLLLLGMALYFLLPLLPKSFSGYVMPVFLFISAVYILFIDKLANNIKGFRIFKIVFSIIILGVGVYQILPSNEITIDWKDYSEANLITSKNNGRPVLIDIYADWCIPCKELDHFTFSDPRVVEISKKFDNYKADMTHTLSPEVEKIRTKYKIIGVPTLLLINSEGDEVKRITGFVPPEEFYKYLSEVK